MGMGKLKYLVPNFFTALSLILGFVAILITFEGLMKLEHAVSFFRHSGPYVILASWIIVWCVLLDKLDGFSAKLLNATSAFGAQFDSMADLVSFGVTPAMLAYGLAHAMGTEFFTHSRILLIICMAFYVLAAAVRLARFNAVDIEELPDFFRGLPSTIAGGCITIIVILLYKYRDVVGADGIIIVLEIGLVGCGALMVSPLLLSKLKPRKNMGINIFQIINIAIAYVCGFGMLIPEYLFFLILLYLSVGFTYGLIKRKEILGK